LCPYAIKSSRSASRRACTPRRLTPHSCLIDLALTDLESGNFVDDHDRVTEEDIEEIEARVFKVRPFASGEQGRQAASQDPSKDATAADDGGEGIGVNMRDLSPGDIDKLVTIKGLVIRTTPIIPDMKTAFFRCLGCSHTMTVDNDRGRIAEPERCPREVCGLKGSMSLVHNRCDFADRQVVRLQETPDAVPDGQTPHTVSLCAYDELVDSCKPGDRIRVTGIFRSVPVRVNPRQRTIKALFKTYLDVLHIQKTDRRRLGTDGSTNNERAVGVGGDERTELEQVRPCCGHCSGTG
jgi:DNA replication licensing factor MCM4